MFMMMMMSNGQIVSQYLPPSTVLRIADLLFSVDMGVDARAQDIEGATALHDLVKMAAQASQPYGLVHRRRRWNASTLASSSHSSLSSSTHHHLATPPRRNNCLDAYIPVVQLLVAHGARLSDVDRQGRDCIRLAVDSGIDAAPLIKSATMVRQHLYGVYHGTAVGGGLE